MLRSVAIILASAPAMIAGAVPTPMVPAPLPAILPATTDSIVDVMEDAGVTPAEAEAIAESSFLSSMRGARARWIGGSAERFGAGVGVGPFSGTFRTSGVARRATAGYQALHVVRRVVAGGVRASFGEGLVVGDGLPGFVRPAGPRSGSLVVAPQISLTQPRDGIGFEAAHNRWQLSGVVWSGVDAARLIGVSFGGESRRLGLLAGEVRTGALSERIASASIVMRRGDIRFGMEVAHERRWMTLVRLDAGRDHRWRLELASGAPSTGYGALLASPSNPRSRQRASLMRSGQWRRLRHEITLWSLIDTDAGGIRRRDRVDCALSALSGGVRVSTRVRVTRDNADTSWRTDLNADATVAPGVRHRLGVAATGVAGLTGVALFWRVEWRTRVFAFQAGLAAAEHPGGALVYFGRAGIGGLDTIGVLTGRRTDLHARADLRLGRLARLSGYMATDTSGRSRALVMVELGAGKAL